jgi:cobalt-zinc-cadmium efflux system outer membrane protein
LIPIVRLLARGIVAGTLCTGGSVAGAQPATSAPPVSLAQAVEAAWQRATESTEAEGQVRRARADLVVASAPWAAPPALEIAHRDDRLLTDAGARETDLGVAVPLWLPGQRGARLAAARAGDEAVLASRDAARLRVAGLVREAVWNVTLQRADVALAQAQASALEALAADVDRRVAAGDLAHSDALAARADTAASSAALTQARARLQVSLTRWHALTGLAVVPDADPTADRSFPTGPGEDHPLLQSARRNVELARKRLDAVNASRRAPPELLARVRTEVSSRADASRNSIGIGLRIPFATDDRNAPLLAAATADLDVAVAGEQLLRRQLEADVQASLAEAEAAERQIAAQQMRARLLRERAALLDRSFRAGETSLPEMLRVLSSAAQADAALERQRAEAGLAHARLQHALGIQP